MKTLHLFFGFLFTIGNIFAQIANFEDAPLNPIPLEAFKYVVPSELQGDVAYFAGKYYDEDRKQRLEDGSSFMKFAQWTKEEAKIAKSLFMSFNRNNQLTEYIIYNGSSPLTYLYEYDSKGNLIKFQYQKDIVAYTYDKKGRLDTEIKTYNTSGSKVSIKYAYTSEGNLLKIFKTSTYSEGSETEEMHYKNGRKIYEKSALGVESVCEPDSRGNCVSKRFIKDNRVDRVFYNVIYRDQLKAKNVVIRDIRANKFAVSVPQIEIEGSKINLPMERLKEDILIYLPNTQQYLIAKDFYNSAVEKENPVPVEILQSNSPYLGIWYSESFPVFLKNGTTERLIKYGDTDYNFYYDLDENKYFYIDKKIKGVPNKIISYKELNTEMLMYMNETLTTNTTLVKGVKQYFATDWSSKSLSDKEVVLLYKNEPLYIVPIITKPEPLKIYTSKNYDGEKYK